MGRKTVCDLATKVDLKDMQSCMEYPLKPKQGINCGKRNNISKAYSKVTNVIWSGCARS